MNLLEIINVIHPYRQLLLAFSGGLDSTVLLHCLMLWRKDMPDIMLRAIHINHGLSINANLWVDHCKMLCANWNIPLLVKYVTLTNEKLGIEGRARKVRYDEFNKALSPGEVLITAHHLNDQMETFLLALKRGSGPKGLSAMPVKIAFAGTQLIRPLLSTTRTTLLCWAKMHNLSWIEDESNQNQNFDRTFLRMNVLPQLIQRWPYFPYTVARSAKLCAEQEELLDELLDHELSKIMTNDRTLAIAPLVSMSIQHRSALLRRWLATHGAQMPSMTMLHRIWNEVALARKDASPSIYIKGYTIRRFYGQLWWVTNCQSLREVIINWPNIYNTLILPQGYGKVSLIEPGNIRLPLPSEMVSIRFKAIGKLRIAGCSNRYKLIKKIWQEYNVPPWIRDTTPMLFYNETLITVAKLFITHEGWANNGVQLEWKE